jgi:spore coat polysaccharide biosynthesis protein SpsF
MHDQWPDYAFVIQARLGSTRLPGKIMLAFGASTVLGTLIDNLFIFGVRPGNVLVATTCNRLDDLTAEYAASLGVKVVRGDEADVLQRYQVAARQIETANIIRLTADNPLPDLKLIEHCLRRHDSDHPDLTSTRFIDPAGRVERFVPKGSSIDIMTKSSLLEIDGTHCSMFEKEHVVPYFYGNLAVSLVKDFKTDRPELSIDTVEDYVRVSLFLQENRQWLMPGQHRVTSERKNLFHSARPEPKDKR